MDIERIKSLAEAKEDENWRFRVYLKGLDLPGADLDRLVWRHLEDVTRRIDCCSCANCCTVISPLLSHKDVRRLAGHVGIEETQLIGEYLRLSKERDRYMFQHRPCRFLHDKYCTVYEARPDDCRSFPHLHKREFRSRLIGASICPIVCNVVKRLKRMGALIGPRSERKQRRVTEARISSGLLLRSPHSRGPGRSHSDGGRHELYGNAVTFYRQLQA